MNFLHRGHHSLLVAPIIFAWEVPDGTPTLPSRATLNSKTTVKKHKNVKNVVLNWTLKSTLVYSVRAEPRRQGVTLFDSKPGMCVLGNLGEKKLFFAIQIFATLYMSGRDSQSAKY